jgi:ABC-type phosphate/phosphonate transport system permease subunit
MSFLSTIAAWITAVVFLVLWRASLLPTRAGFGLLRIRGGR